MTAAAQYLADTGRDVYTRVQGALELLRNVVLQSRPPPQLSTDRDLNGQVIIVTGSNAGIGRETSAALVARGAHVILACRNTVKAEEAAKSIQAKSRRSAGHSHPVEVAHLDLASLASVRAFAADFHARALPLDVLVCNAGIMAPPKRIETEDGMEQQFQVNYLGHWLLTNQLLAGQRQLYSQSNKGNSTAETQHHRQNISAPGAIKHGRAGGTRVVVLSSMTHSAGRIKFDDLQATKSYSGFHRYADSKLAELLAVRSFAQRMDKARQSNGTQDSICAVHPGLIQTELARQWLYNEFPVKAFRPVIDALFRWTFLPPSYAVNTMLHAITASADQVHGKYITLSGAVKSSRLATDDSTASRLWDVSCQLTDIPDKELYNAL